MADNITRRNFIAASAVGASAIALPPTAADAQERQLAQPEKRDPTRFQIACMTLPYSQHPLERALQGLRTAGYAYIAWGTTHREDGKPVPILAADAPVARARDLAGRCRDMGLEPVMMFSGIYPEAKDGFEVLRTRVQQAGAGRVPQVLTFGHTRG